MKYILFFLIAASASANDYGDLNKCGPLKFKFEDIVTVIDKDNFYEGCSGEVRSRTSDCDYYVWSVCNETSTYFKADQLKLKRKGTRN